MKKILTLVSLCLIFCNAYSINAKAKSYTVASPDGKTIVAIIMDNALSYSVTHNGLEVLAPSTVSMTINGIVLPGRTTVKSAKKTTVSNILNTPVYKASAIREEYNQIDLKFHNGFGVIFRAYNEGAAYRFYSAVVKEGDKVTAEGAEYNFGKDRMTYIPYSRRQDNPFQTSFESRYDVAPLSEVRSNGVAFSPVLVCLDNGMKVAISESDLEAYPGMFLTKNEGSAYSIKGIFANIPSQITVHPTRCQEKVASYSDVMAVISATASSKEPRLFPWRLLAITEKDTDLPVNNLVYLLGSPSRVADPFWIKPGKVAWDWWNNWGITGVDFPAGINTQTYKYFIDFASANGIEYVVLDEGWSSPKGGDIMSVIPEIDLEELISYGKSREVDLILWCVAFTLDKKLEEACKHYSEMGIKGFKVDFMDRDDQQVVMMNYRIAEMAAKYKMLIDYHGMYKPAGMNRTFPNVINFEGVWGLEQMKWSTEDMMTYDVTFPYIRMFSGPVDYTQGAMRNSIKSDFTANNNNPMSQGTRAHQVATYVVFDSPLVMLCDNPTIYMKEQETTDYIVSIPTVWDETRVIAGEVGKYIVTARRSGDKWYIGALTGWEGREVTLNLDFLTAGKEHKALLFRDGVNANRSATDYKVERINVKSDEPLTVKMANGGGFALIIE